jgi:hypothetical protein
MKTLIATLLLLIAFQANASIREDCQKKYIPGVTDAPAGSQCWLYQVNESKSELAKPEEKSEVEKYFFYTLIFIAVALCIAIGLGVVIETINREDV